MTRLSTFILMAASIVASSFLVDEVRAGNHLAAVILVNIVAFSVPWLVRKKRQQPEIKPTAGAEPGECTGEVAIGLAVGVMILVAAGLVGRCFLVTER